MPFPDGKVVRACAGLFLDLFMQSYPRPLATGRRPGVAFAYAPSDVSCVKLAAAPSAELVPAAAATPSAPARHADVERGPDSPAVHGGAERLVERDAVLSSPGLNRRVDRRPLAGDLAHDLPSEHHSNAVGECQEFLELGGDQDDAQPYQQPSTEAAVTSAASSRFSGTCSVPSYGSPAVARSTSISKLPIGTFSARYDAAPWFTNTRSSRTFPSGVSERTSASRVPRVLISGSAVGYYGPHDDEPLDERAPPGEGFLASVCQEWEEAARPAEQPERRRAGHVLVGERPICGRRRVSNVAERSHSSGTMDTFLLRFGCAAPHGCRKCLGSSETRGSTVTTRRGTRLA